MKWCHGPGRIPSQRPVNREGYAFESHPGSSAPRESLLRRCLEHDPRPLAAVLDVGASHEVPHQQDAAAAFGIVDRLAPASTVFDDDGEHLFAQCQLDGDRSCIDVSVGVLDDVRTRFVQGEHRCVPRCLLHSVLAEPRLDPSP